MNLLIPTAGNRYLHLQSFKDNPKVDKLITTEINPFSPALHIADKCYKVPPILSEKYLEIILKICRAEEINAIIPIMDQDVFKFSQERKTFVEKNIRLMIHPEETINLAIDKWKTIEFLSQNGFETPATWLFKDISEKNEINFPLFIKPRYGYSRHTPSNIFRIVDSRKTLNEMVKIYGRYKNELIIQEKLSGTEITADFFCDKKGRLVGAVPGERLRALSPAFSLSGGQITAGKTFKSDYVHSLISKLTSIIHFTGPANIQGFRQADGKIKITEINPRYTGACVMTRAAGFDIFEAGVDFLLDKELSFNKNKIKEITMTSWIKPLFFEENPESKMKNIDEDK